VKAEPGPGPSTLLARAQRMLSAETDDLAIVRIDPIGAGAENPSSFEAIPGVVGAVQDQDITTELVVQSANTGSLVPLPPVIPARMKSLHVASEALSEQSAAAQTTITAPLPPPRSHSPLPVIYHMDPPSPPITAPEGSWLNPAVITIPRIKSPSMTPPVLPAPGSWTNPISLESRMPKRPPSPDSLEEQVVFATRKGKTRRILSPSLSPERREDEMIRKRSGDELIQRRRTASPDSLWNGDDRLGLEVHEAVTPGQMTATSDDPLLLSEQPWTDLGTDRNGILAKTNNIASPPTMAVHANEDGMLGEVDSSTTMPHARGMMDHPPASLNVTLVEKVIENVGTSVADVDLNLKSLVESPSLPTSATRPSLTLTLPEFEATEGLSTAEYLRRRLERRLAGRQPTALCSPTPTLDPSGSSNTSDEPELIPAPIIIDYPERDMERQEWRRIVIEDGESDIEILLDKVRPGKPRNIRDEVVESVYKDAYDTGTQSLVVEQPPEHLRAVAKRNFDSGTIDAINHLKPTMTPNPRLHRMIFEALLAQSELESGGIPVVNTIDAEGAPPDFEFECSNEILYHPEVPDPELGLGCHCEGPCNPADRSCTCLRRQELYSITVGQKGFAYDG
jgi:hypothetical protein